MMSRNIYNTESSQLLPAAHNVMRQGEDTKFAGTSSEETSLTENNSVMEIISLAEDTIFSLANGCTEVASFAETSFANETTFA